MSSLADQLRKKKAAADANKDTKDVKAEMLKIARDEANAKFPGVMKVVENIVALGVGMPQLEGELAKAVGVLSDPPQQNVDTFKGEGELGEYACATAEELQQLLEEATALLNESAQTSEPTPAETSKPADETAASAIDEAASDTPKAKGRGKGKKKDQGGVTADAAVEKTPTNAGETSSGATTSTPAAVSSDEKLHFYVDCIPSAPFQSFWPYAFAAMNALAAKLSEEEKKQIPDPRLGDPNGKAGFGRWKALISTYLKANAPKSGRWVLDGTYGELAQEVVVAMREICEQTGGEFVRGTR